MAVIGAAGLYKVRIYKRASGNAVQPWGNTYEVQLPTAFSPADAQVPLHNMIEAEAACHLENVIFDRIVLSTYQADSEPYEGDEFMTVLADGVQGAREFATNQPHGRHIVWKVGRETLTGFPGKLQYRGVLQEEDTTTSSGLVTGMTPASVPGFVGMAATLYTSFMTQLEAISAGAKLVLVHRPESDEPGPPAALVIRQVTAFVHRGVGYSSPDHKWFDVPAGA